MKGNAWVMVAVSLCLLANAAKAQYSRTWQCTTVKTGLLIGCENTDNDPAKELVLKASYYDADTFFIVDGATGTVEWTLPTNCSDNYLFDVNGDGKYELLLYGDSGWELYSYAGGGVSDENPVPQKRFQQVLLGQPEPNPAVTATIVSYSLAQSGRVTLRIYDAAGNLVRTLYEGTRKAGSYSSKWNTKDSRGATVAGGSYFYEMDVDGNRQARRVIVVR